MKAKIIRAREVMFDKPGGTHLVKFLYQGDETFAVFLALMVADARYPAELFKVNRFLGGQGVEHFVAKHDIRRKALLFGTLAAQ